MSGALRPAILACALFAVGSPAFSQTTGLLLDSMPGDSIGGGVRRMYGGTDAAFGATRNYENGIQIRVIKTSPYEDWRLDFSAHGAPLTVGTYSPATRFPFASFIGMDISGMSRGCNELVGRFQVLEVAYDAAGNVLRFAADFEQHCSDANAALFGAIRYNSTVATFEPFGGGYPSYRLTVSEPQNGVITAAGLQCGGGAIDCEVDLSQPAGVSLTATPADGFLFAGWTGACHGTRTAVVNVNMPKHCAARFEPISAPARRTLLFWHSRRGDWVGAGRREVYAAANSTVAAVSLQSGNGVQLEVTSLGDHDETTYRLDFRAPLGSLLMPGIYTGATRASFRTTTPGLDVSGDGRGCNQVLGSFTVHEIAIAANGAVEAFAADFEQRCEMSTNPPLFGSVRFNSQVDLVPTFGLNVNGWGQVTITPPSRSCGDDCAQQYAAGTNVALTATPSAGWIFEGWSGDPECSSGSLVVASPALCTATFVAVPKQLQITVVGEGRVTSSPAGIQCGLGSSTCSATFPPDTYTWLTVSPAAGWVFHAWEGDAGCGSPLPMTADRSCRAVFRLWNVCAYGVTPASIDAPAAGGTYDLSVSSYSGCFWSAASQLPWITSLTTGSMPGGAPQTVRIQVAPKASPGERVASVIVGGVTVPVRQTGASVLTRPRWDLDSDGRTEITVWRPGEGNWFTLNSSTGFAMSAVRQWGSGALGDKPVPGDYDGDGRMDYAIWRPDTGVWHILTSGSGYTRAFVRQWGSGALGDYPVAGDYDGDGTTDLAVWRPGPGNWYILKSTENLQLTTIVQWGSGAEQDQPVPADYDGDGATDLAVWRPGTGLWYVRTSASGFMSTIAVQWGSGADRDVPIATDFDGDGRVELTVWRPASGIWYILSSTSDYRLYSVYQWGAGALADRPVTGDYDGDGRADIAVWRPESGVWFIRLSSSGYAEWFARQWGARWLNDLPIAFW